ncbi:phosphosugar-binding protein [Lentilactobacillus kosonis]|uniref:Phosphosugar-binding protein n=1 Tax=Lentilactobacillus kosonis TaxID=2810561 RepID=A0A401FIP7_9LACO|nr:phosphosugar-binding protein [Lentilactobacillus kosonis]
MNFFEIINPNIEKLTKNEYEILDYVIKHMNEIHNQNIREVAAACFVSTTTFLRFVRKVGFSGYSEFTTVIKYTVLNDQSKPAATATFDMQQSDYRSEYLKNIDETVRVLDDHKLDSLCELMLNKPKIFIYAKGFSKYAAEYVEYLYTLEGFLVVFPRILSNENLLTETLLRMILYLYLTTQEMIKN